jgi:hypothetical protein
MASTAVHCDPAAAAGELHDVKACALRTDLDAQNIQFLQQQVKKLEGALGHEHARGETQAAAFMEVARTCDNRARELEVQFTEKLARLERSHDSVVAAKNATIADLKKQNAKLDSLRARAVAAKDAKDAAFAKLEREHAALKAEATALKAEVAAQISAVHAAVTSKFALELHPVRWDRRQFATLHVGPVPFDEFDTAWCAAACGDKWKVDIDPVTHMRAQLTHIGGYVTLRGAAPLPRRVPSIVASPQQLPSYRVVIEEYPTVFAEGKNTQWCNVGFVPSHTFTDGAPVAPVMGHNIHSYGGWWFQVTPQSHRALDESATLLGWKPLLPRATAAGDVAVADTSAYATENCSPPVPAGSAIELAVDHAAGTCRVAFYTPAAVAGGFAEAPYAKMELRFVATDAEDVPDWDGAIPARLVPSAAADSRVQLYPVVAAGYAGAVCRFE